MTASLANSILASVPWMPEQASTVARDVDWLFNFILAVTVFFTVLIMALMAFFAVRYRHREGVTPKAAPSHSTFLEVFWTVIPMVIVIAIFFWGFRGYMDMIVTPPNAYEIQVNSQMWNWEFVYPNGVSSDVLHIPKDRPVRLVLTSADVIHALYIPVFRIQKMTVPGRYNRIWVQATELSPPPGPKHTPEQIKAGAKDDPGGWPIECAMYCGKNHSEMLSRVHVQEEADFQKWLFEEANLEKKKEFTPQWAGQKLYTTKGCVGCHSIDGTANTGPTWKDLFGKKRDFVDGSSLVADENYISDSILNPGRHIVQGYGNNMPSYLGRMTEKEIGWIIAYQKTISANYKATTTEIPASGPTSGPASGPVITPAPATPVPATPVPATPVPAASAATPAH